MKIEDFIAVVPTEEQKDALAKISTEYKLTAEEIFKRIPSSAHRSAALRLLLESKMTLIHGITHPSES